jgi:hypothetical protein
MAFYIAGDKVKLVSSKKYGTVAAVLSANILVYWNGGKIQSVASNLLEPNYGRRGK